MNANSINKDAFNRIYMKIMFLEGENAKNKKIEDSDMVKLIIEILKDQTKGELL